MQDKQWKKHKMGNKMFWEQYRRDKLKLYTRYKVHRITELVDRIRAGRSKLHVRSTNKIVYNHRVSQ